MSEISAHLRKLQEKEIECHWDSAQKESFNKLKENYVYGREFEIESDHKPLESIFRKQISETPARISRFLMQLQKYD